LEGPSCDREAHDPKPSSTSQFLAPNTNARRLTILNQGVRCSIRIFPHHQGPQGTTKVGLHLKHNSEPKALTATKRSEKGEEYQALEEYTA
jgi:hypothetical protein